MTQELPEYWAPILQRAAGQKPRWFFWIIVALLLGGLNLYAPGEPTTIERGLASLVIIVAAASIWSWMRRRKSEVAFIPLLAIMFAIDYGLGIFLLRADAYLDRCPMTLLAPSFDEVLALCVAGLAITIFGYYGPWWKRISPKLPKYRLCWRDAKAIQVVACVLALVSLVAFRVQLHESLPHALRQPFGVLANMFFLCMITLVLLHFEGRLSTFSKLLLYGVFIPGRVFIGSAQGQFAFAIVVALAFILVYATMKSRIPWLLVFVGFLGFSILQPVKASFRKQVWVGGGSNNELSDSDKMQALFTTAQFGMTVAETVGWKTVISLSMERLSQIVLFVRVVEFTPSEIPYWHGSTYYPIFFKFIPRAIYPDKPDEDQANQFGHWYQIIQPDDDTTAINIPQLVEFYGNFGPWGVLFGSLLIGIFYRLVHDLLIHKETGLGALATAIYFLCMWLDTESNLSLVLGGAVGLLLTTIMFHLLVGFVSKMRNTYAVPRSGAYAAG